MKITRSMYLDFISVLLFFLRFNVEAQEFDPMEICQGKPDNATVINPLSCNSFLLCQNNMPAGSGQCPSDMLYNVQKQICDFYENVDCGSVPIPPDFEQPSTGAPETTTILTEITTPSSSAIAFCPTIDDPILPLYLPIVDDCSSYIMCYHGNPLIMHCPNGMEWNRIRSICDLPEIAKCQTIFQDPYGCPETGTLFLAHPTNCEKFIYCLNGISRVQVCQMFKHFDPIDGECVLGKC